MKKIVFFLMILVYLSSCNNKQAESNYVVPTSSHIVTKDYQSSITPDEVIDILKKGNALYQEADAAVINTQDMRLATAPGQYPLAIVLSCIDSRVPVEDIFQQTIGSLFVARVAGNVADQDVLGSMEYACGAAGSKLILVLGHSACGAVKGSIDQVEMGNLTNLLSKIYPSVEETRQHYEGEQSSKNAGFVDAVAQESVNQTIQSIRNQSEILRKLEEEGQIKIVGAFYNLETGKVNFF